MGTSRTWLDRALENGRVSRRDFVKFCGTVAALFSLPEVYGAKMAHAVGAAEKPTLVWLHFQECTGNSESFLRASQPSAAEVILNILSVDYHETIMAAAGHQAEDVLKKIVEEKAGAFIAVVEGSIPTGANGAYCMIGGRSSLDIAREVCGAAAATIAAGTCATFGGLPAAAPNPTGALSVMDAVPGVKNLINMPACPLNAENLTALIVYYLTFQRFPPLDRLKRPLFAYGKSIHDNCERRAHYDGGQYVEEWGDRAHRSGYCLYKMGCKGPVTYQNCPVVRWNDGTNWPIGCGHPCIGCAEPDFWDKMTPFYRHLKGVPGFNIHTNIDKVGLWLTGAVGAAFAVHGAGRFARSMVEKRVDAAKKDTPKSTEGGEQ
jgi:hydrogenase small subunit